MPIYEYRCTGCGKTFEVIQKPTDGPEGVVCPSCGRARPEKIPSSCCAPSSHGGEGSGAPSTCSSRRFS